MKKCSYLIIIGILVASFTQLAHALPLPGMPPVHDPKNIYVDAGVNMLSDTVRSALPRVYVPNSRDNTISIIDPTTYQVLATLKVGKTPQHIVPAYDLKTLWVLNNDGQSMTPIDPKTATLGKEVRLDHPYNLYYTPDGRFAIEVSEAHQRLNFYDAQTMQLTHALPVNCPGVNHMDFTADGRYAIATCEYAGKLVKIDIANQSVVDYLSLTSSQPLVIGPLTFRMPNMHSNSMPQDIRASPNGQIFFVADMTLNGVELIDPITFHQIGFIATGEGTHSVYPSRDGKLLYIANRGCSSHAGCHPHPAGNITVLDPVTQHIVATWPIPGGGSPDMGNITADGKELWLSGRYDGEVYVFDTRTGQLTHRIPVGKEPHGLTVWPQPGRYSLGHTGNMR